MRSLKLSVRSCAFALCFSLLSAPLAALGAFTEEGATWLGGVNYPGRSVSLADIDNDGDLDAYFQGSASQTSNPRKIWRNNTIGAGTNTFTDVTSTWLPSGLTVSWSAAWGDYNGDGKIDVFVGQENSSPTTGRLLRNTGTSFVDDSVATGLNDPGFHQNVGWIDINNDQRLDLLIGMEGPEKHAIYLQDATGHFTNVGAAAGFQADAGTKGYGMAIGDTDGDGDLDVYISTCRGDNSIRNNFYKNMLKETGTLTFVDIADTNGTQITKNTYGTEFIDLDNDGDLDLYVIGAEGTSGSGIPETTKFFRNDGNNQFTDVQSVVGRPVLPTSGGNPIGTDPNGSRLIDYDNDGDLDLFFHDNLSGVSNIRLFRNDSTQADPWRYTDVTATEGITNTGAGAYDGTWGDIDRDGDLDLINPNNSTLSGNPTPERVYINNASTNGNHWLYVKLKGPSWDTTGIGSSLYATLNDGTPEEVTLRREANTNPDTFNQSDLPVHFGLGSAMFVNRLLIRWADGMAQVINGVAGDQYLTVTYNPGDYNGDNIVDTRDYAVWRKGMGTEFNTNDYLVWRSRFGTKITPGAGTGDLSAVPEPTALAMLSLGLIAAGLGTIRRR